MNCGQDTLFGKKVISSISYNESEILNDILYLHNDSKPIELDCCYSTGNIYNDTVQSPKLKFDINPQHHEVKQADCRNLPLDNESISSMLFDPPFLAGVQADDDSINTGIMRGRFTSFKNIPELWIFYREALTEFYRIMKGGGF